MKSVVKKSVRVQAGHTVLEPIAGRAVLPRRRIHRKPAARQRSPTGFMGNFLFLTDLLMGHGPVDGRARPSRRAARRALNTSRSARWGQARPTLRFMGSSHGF
ncbi:MAG: hypothetical protein FJ398_14455 [Verrucomicrobia bacterium]|nr:hypothetical protein [Verrucomicrobiota bacterium]